MTLIDDSTLCPMCGHALDDHIPGVAFGPYVCLTTGCECSFPQTAMPEGEDE